MSVPRPTPNVERPNLTMEADDIKQCVFKWQACTVQDLTLNL
jgi:hypothetical protein